MKKLDKEDYQRLVDTESEMCISMYFPTFKTGADIKQNPIRFKQRIREAEDKLYNMELTKDEVEAILKPASNLVDETKFWQNQDDSLAIFIADKESEYFQLPFEVKEKTVLGKKFYTKPLLPLISYDEEYFILAISQNENRLFKASKQHIEEIEMKNAPESVESMKQDDDPRSQLPIRTANPEGGNSLVYNMTTQGQANENDFNRNEMTKYFRAIDACLEKYKKKNTPLILAGVEYLIPIFREKSKYPNILDEYIRGNPEILDAKDLHKQSWEIIEEKFTKIQQLAEEKYLQYKGQKNGLASNSISKILPEAYKGQIETLFISKNLEKWGKFIPEKDKVQIYNNEKFDSEDLVGVAIDLTQSRGGTVYSMPQEKIPDNEEIAAVLRY